MADRITDTIPRTRTVTVAGAPVAVRECTVGDLADFQEWLDARGPDPMDGFDERLAAESDGAGRDRVLFDALAACSGPATLDERWGELFTDPEGLAKVLNAALPGVARIDLITPGEWENVRRVFFASDPVKTVVSMLGFGPSPGEPGTWSEAVADVCREYGWTADYVASLTLTQFRTFRRRGKPEFDGFRVPAHRAEEMQDRICRARFGKSAAEHFATGGPTTGGGTR